jgi:hypothetical protein
MNQRRNRQEIVRLVLAMGLFLGLLGLLPLPASAGARNPCVEPGNLTYNCGFDVFVDRFEGEKRLQIPDGWWYFILDGSPDFRPAEDTYWGAPSLWLLTDGVPFTAGIYQQVNVTPGVVYQADAGWAAVTVGDYERKLGLDPSGGTNPLAPSVVWGPSERGINSWPDLTVSARATGPTMTVFVWISHQQTYGNDWIFVDAVGLWPDLSQPAATVTPKASPTFTPKPPTRTPKPAPPTETPTEVPPSPTPTEMPTEVPTALPTDTPAPTFTPTWTPTPSPLSPTDTPTPTPTLTPVPVAGPTLVGNVSTPAPMPAARVQPVARGARSRGGLFLYIALGALASAVLLGGLVLWLWLRGSREV